MGTSEARPVAELLVRSDNETIALPWDEARDRISDARYYWLTTVHPSGQPQVRPVLAVWVGDLLCTTSGARARKGRNLERDPHCSVAVLADDMQIAVEGMASRVTNDDMLERVAEAYRSKYSWPVTVVNGAFDAPYGAPTAGPPPYQLYAITPATVFGFVIDDAVGPRHTRWRF
jgi:Pyridoxamine 5'-phosphate oxidase